MNDTQDTRILDLDVARAIEQRAKALLPDADVILTSRDTYHLLDDGRYSSVYDRYAVDICLRDARSGNIEKRSVDSVAADIDEIVADMRRKLGESATRARKAAATEKYMETE